MRPLDHLVLPVTDIATARDRLTQLGFTVAADARHPFGTENACVFLRDKTYLEPLGIGDAGVADEASRSGNQFTVRDDAFRFRNGPEGLSAIVLGTEDADADNVAFQAAGISAGDQLTFSRVMKFPDGTEIEPKFKLSFAADLRAPDFFAFTCQRINMPPADRSALERHANGVVGLHAVVLTEPQPGDFSGFLEEISGGPVSASTASEVSIQLSNIELRVLGAEAMHEQFGLEISPGRGLHGRAVVFKVEDLTITETLLGANGVTFSRHHAHLIVPQRPGQGVVFVFSE